MSLHIPNSLHNNFSDPVVFAVSSSWRFVEFGRVIEQMKLLEGIKSKLEASLQRCKSDDCEFEKMGADVHKVLM